jgi:hypothetical protein
MPGDRLGVSRGRRRVRGGRDASVTEDRVPHGDTAAAIGSNRVTTASQGGSARSGQSAPDAAISGIASICVRAMNACIRVIRTAIITPYAASVKESRRSSPITVRIRTGSHCTCASPAGARMMIT